MPNYPGNSTGTDETGLAADEKQARDGVTTENPEASEHEQGEKAGTRERIHGGLDGAAAREDGATTPVWVLGEDQVWRIEDRVDLPEGFANASSPANQEEEEKEEGQS